MALNTPRCGWAQLTISLSEEVEKKTESLSRALSRDEVEELFLARDAVMMNKASRKEIDEGHLPHDTRENMYRPHRMKATPTARRACTAAEAASVASTMEQAELDEIKADVKRLGVKAAERAAKQAVAAALGLEFVDEAPDEATDTAYPAVAAAMNATCAVDFAASAEWKEMKQWRAKVDADSAETKKTMTKLAEAQSKMAGDFATGRAENQYNFDALTEYSRTCRSQWQAGSKPSSKQSSKGHARDARCRAMARTCALSPMMTRRGRCDSHGMVSNRLSHATPSPTCSLVYCSRKPAQETKR